MITDVWHFVMNVDAPGPEQTVYITVQFQPQFGIPQPNITATMAISAFSQGFDPGGGAGGVGANITHYQHVNAQGMIEDVDVPADWLNNAIDIDRAYAVTFALTAQLAWAYAMITILFRG
jgi:hypothetical protein